MGYAPLEYFEDGTDVFGREIKYRPGHAWDECYYKLIQDMFGISDKRAQTLTEKEFLEYMLRAKFLIKGHNRNGEEKEWDKHILKFVPTLISAFGYQDVPDFKYIVSDLRDVFTQFVILDKWIRNKQVLRPDATFAKYLCETEKLQIQKDTFENLPFNTFYIDLENCNKDNVFGDAVGIFVNIMPIENEGEMMLSLYELMPSNITVSQYLSFNMKACPKDIETAEFGEVDIIETVPAAVKNESTPVKTRINSKLTITLVLQLISYMKVAKPDIVPSPEMKSTYRPKAEIKNKYSEIYKQDVGIRIGKTITDKIKAMKKAKKEQEKEALSKGHKPPVPHFRRAHWHRYWTGKGRTVCELRWIEPVFVCGSYSSDSATDVIIHNIK